MATANTGGASGTQISKHVLNGPAAKLRTGSQADPVARQRILAAHSGAAGRPIGTESRVRGSIGTPRSLALMTSSGFLRAFMMPAIEA